MLRFRPPGFACGNKLTINSHCSQVRLLGYDARHSRARAAGLLQMKRLALWAFLQPLYFKTIYTYYSIISMQFPDPIVSMFHHNEVEKRPKYMETLHSIIEGILFLYIAMYLHYISCYHLYILKYVWSKISHYFLYSIKTIVEEKKKKLDNKFVFVIMREHPLVVCMLIIFLQNLYQCHSNVLCRSYYWSFSILRWLLSSKRRGDLYKY